MSIIEAYKHPCEMTQKELFRKECAEDQYERRLQAKIDELRKSKTEIVDLAANAVDDEIFAFLAKKEFDADAAFDLYKSFQLSIAVVAWNQVHEVIDED